MDYGEYNDHLHNMCSSITRAIPHRMHRIGFPASLMARNTTPDPRPRHTPRLPMPSAEPAFQAMKHISSPWRTSDL
eukprot:scaffold12258_cov158-Skeletonema_menzelii.AAC.10